MPAFFDPAKRQALLDRLARLTADRQPAWGRFTAHKMVLHLTEAMRMATGEVAPRPRSLPLRPLLRPLLIHWLPWPKGAPTAPELLARPPVSWDADLATLRDVIASLPVPAPGAAMPPHPLFGAMKVRDWDVLLHRHIDHHLTQFGL